MRTKLTESIAASFIVIAAVSAILLPVCATLAIYTPLTLATVFQGTIAVGVVSILVGVIGGW